MLRILGAELILTDKKLGTNGAIKKARELVEENPDLYWFVNQFNNSDNIKAHYLFTAKEILEEFKNIRVLVAGIGTSGTIIGIAKRFKKYSPRTKIIGIIPPKGYKIQGIQNPDKDFIGKIYRQDLIDEYFYVSVKNAFAMVRKVAKIEGLFIGMSSGAAIFAAIEKSKLLDSGNVVVIIPDRGEKYLSTGLFT